MIDETTALMILARLALGKMTPHAVKTLHDRATEIDSEKPATQIIEHRNDIQQLMPDIGTETAKLLQQELTAIMPMAEEEELWCQNNKVHIITIDDKRYPDRLRHCDDAPLVIFAKGNADLNTQHILSIVGTRQCTVYGQDVIANIVRELAQQCPGIMIVSGLAYGVDIHSHRAAMNNGLSTIGVVAHGLDTLYPAMHRNDANKMVLGNGAVVTEYFRGTRPVQRNFLQRNRIIAGMSDATLVVESASHGGSLVTARIAQEYNREVLAVPGPVNSNYSIGCNNLIRDSKAALVSSATDIINVMGWHDARTLSKARHEGIERELFVDMSPEEIRITEMLQKDGDCQANMLAMITGMSIATVSSALFSLEMKGVVKALPGNTYHLIS